MAVSSGTPFLETTVDNAVNYRGRPVLRCSSGGWRSAWFIIGVEVGERFAYYGISSNLISYLTGPIGESTAAAAANVNAWSGTATLLPLLGAFIADAFVGRYRTIIVASLIYILGLGLLTLSASLTSSSTNSGRNTNSDLSSPSPFLRALFFSSLYLVAVGQGGHKPCVQAFGADQFDGDDAQERKARSSFFNWWYLSLSAGISLALLVVVYIQEKLNWALGFGIPCIFMAMSLVIFLLGTKTYRYAAKQGERNPFARIGNVFVSAFRNRNHTMSKIIEEEAEANISQQSHQQFKFLDKALFNQEGSVESGNLCSTHDVEEAKALLRLLPIWSTNLAYAVAYAQYTTFFTKQGATMDRKISPVLEIPAASLQLFIGFSIIIFVPVYDRVFVPVARLITREPTGITMLQRIGTGIALSALTMVIAALVETKRLKIAHDHGLINQPDATVPMSIWWLVPQYLMFGLADVFTLVGQQEFFYSQVPAELRSLGLSLYLSVLGIGSFLSSFLVSVVDRVTAGDGGGSWFDSDLNRAHVDYFYWLLSGLCAVGFASFLYCSKSYVYNTGSTN